jgi:hypothetical protein
MSETTPFPASDYASLRHKPDWKLSRDTHGRRFPANVRNWLHLDPIWQHHADAVVGAIEQMRRGEVPSTASFRSVETIMPEELDTEWTVDDPVVRRDLDSRFEWLLLWREGDQFNVFSLYDDGSFDRVFWDVELAGPQLACVVAVDRPSPKTTKSLPTGEA